MPSIAEAGPKSKRRHLALIVALSIPIAACVVYLLGCYMDCEYVHWPTVWQASRAKTSSGIRVAELMHTRATTQPAHPHWHHCGWCETVYSFVEHYAVKVTLSATEAYLFDWDAASQRLVPITVQTAEVFPELIPAGFAVEPTAWSGLDGQLHNDRRCRIVARSQRR